MEMDQASVLSSSSSSTTVLTPVCTSVNNHKVAICIGSGRFLRSVLVPALLGAGAGAADQALLLSFRVAIFQTRGRSLLDYCACRAARLLDDDDDDDGNNCAAESKSKSSMNISYEVDTVQRDGSVDTETIGPLEGVGTLGTVEGKEALTTLIHNCGGNIAVLGVGVTEAGLSSHNTQVMLDLVDILHTIYKAQQTQIHTQSSSSSSSDIHITTPTQPKVCVINTDNVPSNGTVIKGHVLTVIDDDDDDDHGRQNTNNNDNHNNNHNNHNYKKYDILPGFREWCATTGVAFHNTMVDRITSQREGSHGMVPRAEPVPLKALVIE
jgi:hypothetical protein